MRTINAIVIHCAATPPSLDIGVDEIRDWHVDGEGWNDVGYHYVIRRNGVIELGRSLETPGAHVGGYNSRSIGICWVGGVDDHKAPEDNRTLAQKDAMSFLVATLVRIFPGSRIVGHRDYPGVAKACPSFEVSDFFANYPFNFVQETPLT